MRKLIFMFVIVLTGCSHGKIKKQHFEESLQSWVGRTGSDLIKTYGIPTRTATLPDGTKMYEFATDSGNRLVATGNYNYLNATAYNMYCKTSFSTNKEDIVTEWHWEGNRCY